MIQGYALLQKRKRLFSIPFNPKSALFTLALFFGIVLLVSPYAIDEANLLEKNSSPSLTHLFGTDGMGRDLLTRLAAGGALSFLIILTATLSDAALGTIFGITCALSRRGVQIFLLRLFDFFTIVPQILFAMVIYLFTGSGILSLLLTLLATNWIGLARLIRGETMRIAHERFFEAAICSGESRSELIFKTLLPHLKGPLLIKLTHSAAKALYLELFLSYLGVGLPAPFASFGTLLAEGTGAIAIYPWRALFPALFLFALIFSLNAYGDELREESNAS